MSDHIDRTIEQALEELRKHEEAAISTKRLVNQLCVFGGKEPMFQDAELAPSGNRGPVTVRKNSFYGRPLATCIREYLEARKNSGGVKESSLDEIMTALREGSFNLVQITANTDDQPRSVAISLGKNPAFHRLPNGDWGLDEWYESKPKRGRPAKGVAPGNGDAGEEGASADSPDKKPGTPSSKNASSSTDSEEK